MVIIKHLKKSEVSPVLSIAKPVSCVLPIDGKHGKVTRMRSNNDIIFDSDESAFVARS